MERKRERMNEVLYETTVYEIKDQTDDVHFTFHIYISTPQSH